jgi:hypothetical protein
LLAYKVPPEPAKKRIALWRKIKSLGAVYLQNGVCLLPKTDDHVRRLKIVENEIAEMDGESVLLETNGLDRAQEEKLLARFNADRDEAYQEFLERCDGFEAEIVRESAAGKFTFAELEENDEDLKKLASWQRFALCEALPSLSCKRSPMKIELTKVFDAQDENRPAPRTGRPS